MLLVALSVALLAARCASQSVTLSPFGVPFPAPCRGRENDSEYSILRGALFGYLNYLRQSIAKGEKLYMFNETGPKNMYGLRYSCPLEKIASTLLQNGQTQHANSFVFSYTSEMYWEGQRLFPAIQLEHIFRQMIANNDARKTLLYPYVAFFGCAYSYQKDTKPRRLTLLCVLYRDSAKTSRMTSRPCSKDADCARYRNSTCSEKLCWAPTGNSART